MKRYEYVSIKVGKFIGAKSDEHRAISDEYADHGKIITMDLIFEIEK